MGSAMLQSWEDLPYILSVDVLDPHTKQQNSSFTHIHSNINALQESKSDKNWDAIILAVKPQILEDVCKQIAPLITEQQLIISIAAGKTLATIEGYFSYKQPLIRCMPNTPAAIGKGMCVAFANHNAATSHKNLTSDLLTPLGQLVWLEQENLMDPVTALSGSGPAYVFHMIESLTKAGEHIGLDTQTASTLARQTVIGSAALAEAESDISPEQLRINVTSPGGTTEAALNVVMDGRMQELWNEALSAATKRAKELNN